MSGIASKNTKPELLVRRFLHRQGFRFRLHRRNLPGCPDVVLPKYRVAIQVHGCFWHQHPGCRFAYMPSSNSSFWRDKLKGNAARDARNDLQLRSLGWRVFTVWECDAANPERLSRLSRQIRRIQVQRAG